MSERLRISLCYGVFLALAGVLAARLGYLQIGRAAAARERAEHQQIKLEHLPAQRGTLLDRDGCVLACDRQVLEVRADLAVRLEKAAASQVPPDKIVRWIDEIVRALAADPELSERERLALRDKGRSKLLARALACEPNPKREPVVRVGAREYVVRHLDFLVASDVAATATIDALRALQRRDDSPLRFSFTRRFARSYPERETTIGPVGFVSDQDLDARGLPRVQRGIEAIFALSAGDSGLRTLFRDPRRSTYWTPYWDLPDDPRVVHTTLDLSLQKAAQQLLDDAAAGVAAKYETEPDWGALMLVEIESGDVLAMVSFQRGVAARAARFSPTQSVYQPGSVVKPLVFALALERGVVAQTDTFDCTPTVGKDRAYVAGSKARTISDVHPNHERLAPHEILVRSSNIGAYQVGMRLGKQGLEEYLEFAGFGRKTELHLPHELKGKRPHKLTALRDREFSPWTGPSICIGYELDTTPAQLTRAFLTLLSGRPRELRFVRAIDDRDGRHIEIAPGDAGSRRYLSEDTVRWIRTALGDVVSDEPHSTGNELFRQLRQLGVERGVIGGKTGTSERAGSSGKMIRSATFAGFAPVDAPRYLAVCVLQKEGAAKFYGGLYAAPAAGRLLLRALAEELERRHVADPQVSADSDDRDGQIPGADQGGR